MFAIFKESVGSVLLIMGMIWNAFLFLSVGTAAAELGTLFSCVGAVLLPNSQHREIGCSRKPWGQD